MKKQENLPDPIVIKNKFIRGKNIFYSEADFTPLFIDYFEHIKKYELIKDQAMAERFRDMLAAFTLHSAARPRNEVLAWTVHFENPLHNMFLGSDTEYGFVTGRLFTEGVKKDNGNVLYQEQVISGKPLRRSIVTFEGNDIKNTVDYYYYQSEQRPGKFFHLENDRYALFTAHPDFDEQWLKGLDQKTALQLAENEEVNTIETRAYRWKCQCHHSKILEMLTPIMQENPDELFGEEELIKVNCPRCGAAYKVTREAMESKIN